MHMVDVHSASNHKIYVFVPDVSPDASPYSLFFSCCSSSSVEVLAFSHGLSYAALRYHTF